MRRSRSRRPRRLGGGRRSRRGPGTSPAATGNQNLSASPSPPTRRTKSGSSGAVPRRPEEEEDVKARCHYHSAEVDDSVYSLGDDIYVMEGLQQDVLISMCCTSHQGLQLT